MRYGIVAIGAALTLAGCGPAATGPIESGSAAGGVYDAARAAKRRLSDEGLEPIVVNIEMVDRYGKGSLAPAYRFRWSADELAKVDRGGISEFQLLDLSEVEILSPLGVSGLAEWCDDSASATPHLCGPARRRAEDAWVRSLGS